MSGLRVELEDGRKIFVPGDRIRGTASWSLVEPAETLEVRLFWYTRGKGDTDVCVVGERRFENPRAVHRQECTFQLPEAPFSFSGKLVSLVWAVEVVVDSSNESTRLDIVVAPDGNEVNL